MVHNAIDVMNSAFINDLIGNINVLRDNIEVQPTELTSLRDTVVALKTEFNDMLNWIDASPLYSYTHYTNIGVVFELIIAHDIITNADHLDDYYQYLNSQILDIKQHLTTKIAGDLASVGNFIGNRYSTLWNTILYQTGQLQEEIYYMEGNRTKAYSLYRLIKSDIQSDEHLDSILCTSSGTSQDFYL